MPKIIPNLCNICEETISHRDGFFFCERCRQTFCHRCEEEHTNECLLEDIQESVDTFDDMAFSDVYDPSKEW